MSAVVTSLQDLKSGKADLLLDEAFGPDSLGILIIDGLPEKFRALREKVLKSASLLAKLDEEILKTTESPEGYWLVGWSLGKEKLIIEKKTVDSEGKESLEIIKKPDMYKGSYYINCSFFIDPRFEGPPESEIEKYSNHKAYTTLNKWPDLSGVRSEIMQHFEQNCKELCNFIIETSLVVARSCDKYISKHKLNDNFPDNYLESVVANSYTTKARLLHYYPKSSEAAEEDQLNTWCGEHLDHSCLTGLTSAMFLDETSIKSKSLEEILSLSELQELEKSPDSESGLYIRNRHGDIVKVDIPKHCLAFQTGSALQEISNGKFKAVPHYVKGCNVVGIARNTLAVFCQPNLGDKVNDSETFSEYADRILTGNH